MKYNIALVFFVLVCAIAGGCGYTRLLYASSKPSHIHPVPAMENMQKSLTHQYRAGVARAYITPRHDTWLAGFQPYRAAIGVHDNLEVRTLVLVDATGNGFAWVSADLIGFMHNDVERLRSAINIPHLEVFVMSSHTHAGPDTIGIWGAPPFFSGRDEGYINEVIDVMTKTVLEAVENIRPVKIFAGSTNVPDLSKNIRERELIDKELSILLFTEIQTQKPYALVINFGCHPEVLKRENRLISADMVGVVRKHFDDALGITTLFVNGALGGMVQPNMKWNDRETFEKNAVFGERLSLYAQDALDKAQELQNKPILHRRERFFIPLHNKRFLISAILGLMPYRGIISSYGRLATEVNVLAVGNKKIVMVPGEIVPELALEIKALGGPGTQVWSLANDEIGYILAEEKFYSQTFKYERTMSVGPKAGTLVMRAAKKFLKNEYK